MSNLSLGLAKRIEMSHGAGGRLMHKLLDDLIFKEFDNPYLQVQGDQAVLPNGDGKLAFATDSYVVSPYFFSGGNIGSLAINGTVNDLAVGGATPLYISVGLIIEEGFLFDDLKIIIKSMAQAAKEAKVQIVTGDTKVVERGKGDGIFINTSGIGIIRPNIKIEPKFELGDKIIINGDIASHGMAVLAKRNGIDFNTNIKSDCASLGGLIGDILAISPSIRCMRDPTRGGVSAVLNEWANFYNLGININEEKILVYDDVRGLCELLGLDPLHVANEGKVLVVCDDRSASEVLKVMQNHPLGTNARIIGEVQSFNKKSVTLTTTFGGVRRVEWLSGEQLPRIC